MREFEDPLGFLSIPESFSFYSPGGFHFVRFLPVLSDAQMLSDGPQDLSAWLLRSLAHLQLRVGCCKSAEPTDIENGGFHKWGVPHSWMVYNGKPI